jgi:uncharacterized Zn-finger protein
MPADSPLTIEYGDQIDLKHFAKNFHIPNSKNFAFVKYYNPATTRWSQLFVCTEKNCQKQFRKWHNLFDHLRIHTMEQPYECPVVGCSKTFTQRSNLNKHLYTHRKRSALKCSKCHVQFKSH